MKNRVKFRFWMSSLLFLFLLPMCKAQMPANDAEEWLILGPIPVVDGQNKNVSQEKQMEAFSKTYLDPTALTDVKDGQTTIIDGTTYTWKSVTETGDVINLHNLYDTVDFASAYGWREFESDESKEVLLGVGSDDGVKIWLNGQLVHDKWIPRGVNIDDDLVPVTLEKGKNQMLVKVQDIELAWGFACRVLTPEVFSEKLTEAAGNGQYDNVEMLLSYGADINAKNELGLTAYQTAKIYGREEIAESLSKKGADTDIPMPEKGQVADAFFQQLIGKYQPEPGASVLVARDGNILYKKGFGIANMEENISITPETEFRIGSITKQFTAAAIIKLHEEGKIGLDDKLSKFIADYPRGDEVTVHHLLTHTSGIKSYTDKINFESEEVTKPIASVEGHIESFKSDPYNFNPGESWSYNNSGYFLLGYIVEKVSGESYGDYLKKEFFKPLGMKHTGVHYSGIKLPHEAKGYAYQNGKAEIAPDWEMTWAGGAGALYSTVDDLYKWNEAIFNGKVLKEESLKAAFTPVSLNSGEEAQPKYGYGWMMAEFRGWRDISHGGGLPGFVTFLTRFPEQNVTVAVLTNAAPQQRVNPQQVAYDLAEIFFWDEMEPQPTFIADANADAGTYDDYVGRYDYNGAVLTVTNENNRLFAQLTGQQKFEIFPQGNDGSFFWKVVDAQVKFVRNDAGEVIHAVHTQGGQTFEAPRIKEEVAVSVDPSVLDNYVGVYDLNGADAQVTKENEQLWVQVTGQPKFQMFARSDSEFFLKEVNASLTFVENGDGKIEKVVLFQGGRKFDMKRKE